MYFKPITLIIAPIGSIRAAAPPKPTSLVTNYGGFSDSCFDYSLIDTTLYALCQNGGGGYDSTSVDLNQCIANYDGNLACAPGWEHH